jgi:hypothetical protein
MNTILPTVCFDLSAISRFFRSCALTIATQQTTQIQWATYRDSKVLNAVYFMMFWKEPPGFAEVSMATKFDLEKKTDELHQQYLFAWVRKLALEGPRSAQIYVDNMIRAREISRLAVQDLFREVGSINADVINQTQQAISDLAKIKLGAQVGVAVIGGVAGLAFIGAAAAGGAGGASLMIVGLKAGATATGFAVVGGANSITHSMIKTWEGGAAAKVAGVSMEAGKITASEIAGAAAGRSLERALSGSTQAAQIIKSAQGEIAKFSARLAQEGLKKSAQAKATNIVASRTAQAAVQKTALQGFQQTARVAATAGRSIPVLFAALDVWDAVGDYRETMQSNR